MKFTMKLSALALCALANGDQGTKEDMEAAGPERCYYPPFGPEAAQPHSAWCDEVQDKETCADDGGLGCQWGVKPTLEEAAAQQKAHLAQLAARHKTEAEAAQKLGTTFVKCETTKGPLAIEVHHSWAREYEHRATAPPRPPPRARARPRAPHAPIMCQPLAHPVASSPPRGAARAAATHRPPCCFCFCLLPRALSDGRGALPRHGQRRLLHRHRALSLRAEVRRAVRHPRHGDDREG